jgi:hypothetical protein
MLEGKQANVDVGYEEREPTGLICLQIDRENRMYVYIDRESGNYRCYR